MLMSQNRRATKDRVAASHELDFSLQAELELWRLHDWIDLAVAQRLNFKLKHPVVSAISARGNVTPQTVTM